VIFGVNSWFHFVTLSDGPKTVFSNTP
jgi:hypothetical protein